MSTLFSFSAFLLAPSASALTSEVLPAVMIPELNAMHTGGATLRMKPGNARKATPVKGSACWSKVLRKYQHQHLSLTQNPGAGLGEIEPFDRVLKDGFMKLKCIKDALFEHGDKFGANKHDYKLGDVSNVSIVHYNMHVPKEDRKAMTPTVCFDFCRTVPDMLNFGLVNGRECYCAPFHKAMASDSTECDSVCEGDPTQMCGGQGKSNVYDMHQCNDGAQVLAVAAIHSRTVKLALDDLVTKAKDAAEGKQALAVEFQEMFGQAGDPAAGALMQLAKQSAGKLLQAAEDAESVSIRMTEPIETAVTLTGLGLTAFDDSPDLGIAKLPLSTFVLDLIDTQKAGEFMKFEVAKKGDDLVKLMTETTPQAQKLLAELQKLYLLSEPMVNPFFYVWEGPCETDDDGCVMSLQHGGDKYYNDEHCVIEVQGGSIEFEVDHFETEHDYDVLTVNGKDYSGDGSGLSDVKEASGDIIWQADDIVAAKGFKLCGKSAVKNDKTEEERGVEYYPAMYFVDKEQKDFPMTCSGTVIGSPIYFKSYHGCAAACDAHVGSCVGFSYYPTEVGKPNLCFLFSDFTSGQYYTGCEEGGAGEEDERPPKKKKALFLQKGNSTLGRVDQPLTEEPTHPVCVAKLSKFVGTTLKPDKSGKCKQCMKELTEAKRCW